MAKYHATPTGQVRRCTASVRPCQYGQDVHGDTPEAVQAIIDEGFKTKIGAFAQMSRSRKKRVSKSELDTPRKRVSSRDARQLMQLSNVTDNILSLRAQMSDLTLVEDADQSVAQRRLHHAIDFARSRGNSDLVSHISGAKVMEPISGPRGVDEYLELRAKYKNGLEQRERIMDRTKEVLSGTDVSYGKYSFSGEGYTTTMTVSPSVDMDAYDSLPDDVKARISTEKTGIDSEAVRKVLSPEQYRSVVSVTQVIDSIDDSDRPQGSGVLEARELGGGTTEEKVESALRSMNGLYQDFETVHGRGLNEMKSEVSSIGSGLKGAVADIDPHMNAYIPARSVKRGVVVHSRATVNRRELEKILSEDQISRLSYVTQVPDYKKAVAVLGQEKADSLFSRKEFKMTTRKK